MARAITTWIAAACSAVLIAGCGSDPVKITGGGSLQNDTETAHFGFTVNTCSADKIRGQMAYIDIGSGVAAHGKIVRAIACTDESCTPCEPGDMQVVMKYRSLMADNPGEGGILACVTGTDEMYVNFTNGPFAGYQTAGEVQGNLNIHECPPNGK